jgi:HAD superfamily hydrolase (TIGR01459 family)
MIQLPDFTPLLEHYDSFLVDQFGTLHDGVALYSGAASALAQMRAAGKRIVLLSNSGRRSAANAARLAGMGIPPTAYDLFVTSGEVAADLLAQGKIPAAHGARNCLLLERAGDGALLDGLGLTAVGPDDAELVIIAGSEGDRRPLEWYAALLAPLARRGIPALCLNPDRIMLTPSGPAFGAGRIAEAYMELGGAITWIGKPHPAVFHAALAAIGNPDPARVAVIGDSVEHDIAGARGVGCGAWLLRAGIIKGWNAIAIEAECARFGVMPDGLLAALGR